MTLFDCQAVNKFSGHFLDRNTTKNSEHVVSISSWQTVYIKYFVQPDLDLHFLQRQLEA